MANLPGLIEELRTTAGTTRQSADEIDNEARRVDSSVSTLLGAWQGNARNIFEGEWQDAIAQVQQIVEEMHQLAEDLEFEADDLERAITAFGS